MVAVSELLTEDIGERGEMGLQLRFWRVCFDKSMHFIDCGMEPGVVGGNGVLLYVVTHVHAVTSCCVEWPPVAA